MTTCHHLPNQEFVITPSREDLLAADLAGSIAQPPFCSQFLEGVDEGEPAPGRGQKGLCEQGWESRSFSTSLAKARFVCKFSVCVCVCVCLNVSPCGQIGDLQPVSGLHQGC